MIQDCYVEKPRVTLNPAREQPPYWMTDEYESTRCCKLNSEKRLSGWLAETYGYAVVKDILECERQHAATTVLK